MDVNLLLLWTALLGYAVCIAIHRRRTGQRPAWGAWLAGFPPTVFTTILLLRAILSAFGPIAFVPFLLLALATAAGTAAATYAIFARARRLRSLAFVLVLVALPPALGLFPLPTLPPPAVALLLALGLAGAITVPAVLMALRAARAERPRARRLVVALLFLLVVLHGVGLAIALEHPLHAVRRELVLDVQAAHNQTVTVSVYFPDVAPELAGRVRVISGNGTLVGSGHDVSVHAHGPVRLVGVHRFYARDPLPETTGQVLVLNSSAPVTVRFFVSSGFEDGPGCSLRVDETLDLRPHRTYPIEPMRRCVD